MSSPSAKQLYSTIPRMNLSSTPLPWTRCSWASTRTWRGFRCKFTIIRFWQGISQSFPTGTKTGERDSRGTRAHTGTTWCAIWTLIRGARTGESWGGTASIQSRVGSACRTSSLHFIRKSRSSSCSLNPSICLFQKRGQEIESPSPFLRMDSRMGFLPPWVPSEVFPNAHGPRNSDFAACTWRGLRTCNLSVLQSWCKDVMPQWKIWASRYIFTPCSYDNSVLQILSYNVTVSDFRLLEKWLLIPFVFRV